MPDFRFAGDDSPPQPSPKPSFLDAEEETEKAQPQPEPPRPVAPPATAAPIPSPPAPSAAAHDDEPSADDVFSGMSARLRSRPHIPPPADDLDPAPVAPPQVPVPPAPPMPAVPIRTVAPDDGPAVPPLPIPPRPQAPSPAAPQAPPAMQQGAPARHAGPAAQHATPPAPRAPRAPQPQVPSPQIPSAQAQEMPAVQAPPKKAAAPRTPGVPRTPAIPRTPSVPRGGEGPPPPGHPGGGMPSPGMPRAAGIEQPIYEHHDHPHGTPQFSGTHSDAGSWTEEITQYAPVAGNAVTFGAIVAFLAGAFIVYEIASGRLKNPLEIGNFSTAAAVFSLSLVVVAGGLIVSQWSSRGVGFGLAILGGVLMGGVPAFLPKAAASSASLFQGGGFFIFILGLAKIGLDFAIGTAPPPPPSRGRTGLPPQAAAPSAPPGMHRAPTAAQSQYATPLQGQHAPVTPGMPHVSHPSVRAPMVEPQHAQPEIIDDSDQFGGLRKTMESVEPIAQWIFRISAILAALSLGYLLYAIFAGHIGQTSATVYSGTAANVKRAAVLLQLSIIFLTISGTWLAMDMPYLGLMLIGGGLVFYFGAPWALGTAGKTALMASIADSMRSTGFAVAVLGIIKQLYETVRWAMDLPNRMKQKADVGFAKQAEPAQRKVARDANMFSPCWKLPFCREVIRKQCPAFLAKKACWKFGRGCYCDEEMIGRIIRGESMEIIKAPTRMSRTGKAPCGRCHIYLEHQGHKFKLLSPMAFPATAVITYAIWPIYSRLFMSFLNSKFWNVVNFGNVKAPDAIATDASNKPTSSLSPDQVAHVAVIFIGILLGFFVFVQVSKFIEWAIYKAKL